MRSAKPLMHSTKIPWKLHSSLRMRGFPRANLSIGCGRPGSWNGGRGERRRQRRRGLHSAFSEPAYIQAFLVGLAEHVSWRLDKFLYILTELILPYLPCQQEKLVYMLVQKRPS